MTAAQGLQFTDRDLIEAIVESYFIVDYGFISQVNGDGTVNVIHAKKCVTIDGKELPETETKEIEVLTLGCAEFSIQLKPKKGDNVLLLGLKDYVKNASGIRQAQANEVAIHYSQNTMKAFPLSLFNDSAKVQIQIDAGSMTIKADKNVSVECRQAEIKCSGFKVSNSGGTAALEVTP